MPVKRRKNLTAPSTESPSFCKQSQESTSAATRVQTRLEALSHLLDELCWGVAGKQGLLQGELGQYTAERPHVHGSP